MKKQDEALFQLIKSLSTNEKGHFVKYTSALPGIKGLRYMQLFNILSKMKDYDEGLLQKRLTKLSFTKQAHRVRHYLYQLLLNFLENYHRSKTETETNLKLLLRASILSSRRLYNQSNSLLRKVEASAKGSGMRSQKIEALKLRLHNEQGLNNSHAEHPILEEINREAMLNYWVSEINKLNTFFYDRYEQIGSAKTKEEKEKYMLLFNRVNNLIDEEKMDPTGLIILLNLRFIYGVMINAKTFSQKALDQGYHLIMTIPDLQKNKKLFSFFSDNYMYYFLHLKAFSKVKKKLVELNQWLDKQHFTKEEHDTIRRIIYLQKFDLLLADHNLLADTDFITELFNWFDTHKLIDIYENHYHFNKVVYHLYTDQYKESLKYINLLRNNREYSLQHPQQSTELEFLNIIIHCKLGNIELMESLVSSLKRKTIRAALEHSVPHSDMVELFAKYFNSHSLQNTAILQAAWEEELITDLKKLFPKTPQKIEPLTFDYVWYFEEVF